MTARWPALSDRAGNRDRQDWLRKCSDMNASDEIEMLDRALHGDLSPYSPEGIITMSVRLAWLTEMENYKPRRGLSLVATEK
jgi:hypothetical protein